MKPQQKKQTKVKKNVSNMRAKPKSIRTTSLAAVQKSKLLASGKKKMIRKEKKTKTAQKFSSQMSGKEADTVTSTQHPTTPVDLIALTAMIEAELAEYCSSSDTVSEISPALIVMYLIGCALSHIKRVGSLQNDTENIIPVQTQPSTLVVPPGFATWLRGLGKYRFMGTTTLSSVSMPVDFQLANGSWGSCNVFTTPGTWSRTGLANWSFFFQTAQDSTGTVFGFATEEGTSPIPPSLYTLIGNPGNMDKISQILARSGNAITLGSIPMTSLTASAFSQPAGASLIAPTATAPTSWRSVFSNYDPEEAILYNLSSSAPLTTTHFDKAIKREIFDYQTPTAGGYNWYLQPFATLAFIGRTMEALPKKPLMVSLFYGKKRVKSLFPQANYINGEFVSTQIVNSWKTILASSNRTPANDPNFTALAQLSFLAYGAFQHLISRHEVNHVNVPGNDAQFTTGNYIPSAIYILPQLAYTDSAFNSIELPSVLAHYISKFGAVNNAGYLRVPVNTYNGGSLVPVSYAAPISGYKIETIPGPMQTSAQGLYTTPIDNHYANISNIYSAAWGETADNAAAQINFPNVPFAVDAATPSVFQYTKASIGLLAGWQPSAVLRNGTNGVLLPLNPSGAPLSMIYDQWKNFAQLNTVTSQGKHVPVPDSQLGSIVMLANSETDSANANLQTIAGLDATVNNGAPSMLVGTVKSVIASTPLNAPQAVDASQIYQTGASDPNNPLPHRQRFLNLKQERLEKIYIPGDEHTDLQTRPLSAFMANLPVGGMDLFTRQIHNEAGRTGSQLGAGLQRVMDAATRRTPYLANVRNKIPFGGGNHIHAGMKYIGQFIHPYARDLFPKNLNVSVDPKDMGIGGFKSLAPKAAQNVQQILTQEQSSTQEHIGSDSGVKGIFKHGWKAIKNIGKQGVKTVGKGLTDAINDAITDAVRGGTEAVVM